MSFGVKKHHEMQIFFYIETTLNTITVHKTPSYPFRNQKYSFRHSHTDMLCHLSMTKQNLI